MRWLKNERSYSTIKNSLPEVRRISFLVKDALLMHTSKNEVRGETRLSASPGPRRRPTVTAKSAFFDALEFCLSVVVKSDLIQ